MSIATFFNMEWKVDAESVRNIESLESDYSIKLKTDSNTGKETSDGADLRPLNLSYKLVAAAGGKIEQEINKLRAIRGVVAPFYLNKRRLFAPAFMLTEFDVSGVKLSNTGKMIEASFSISFIEVSLSLGTSDLKVIYNDTDITKDISVVDCEHEMNAENKPDELSIKFADNNHLWDDWQPEKADTIQAISGVAKTGKMFIESVNPEDGYMKLIASSIPKGMRKVVKENNKSWQNVTLLQVINELANRNGLQVEAHDVDNKKFTYMKQENISDLDFIVERCDLEGYSFLVYDGKIVVYSPEKIEQQAAVKNITVPEGSDFKYNDDSLNAYGACELDNGSVEGKASAGNGIENVLRKVVKSYISSKAEANLNAKNILNKANRGLKTGKLETPIMRDVAAASIANLKTTVAASNDGKIFYEKVRHDYVKKKTKHFFRFV